MRIVKGLGVLAILAFVFAFTCSSNSEENPTESVVEVKQETKGIKWYTWEEAIKLHADNPRDIVIDLYTDWCHWCKVMDKKTFSDKGIGEYVNANFYAVKFNAEQKESINWNGHEFKHLAAGRRGIHELAYSLMDGRASYPTVVYLNKKLERIMVSPGFKEVPQFKKELDYVNQEAYKTTSWTDYQNSK